MRPRLAHGILHMLAGGHPWRKPRSFRHWNAATSGHGAILQKRHSQHKDRLVTLGVSQLGLTACSDL